ncbi:MAG TPA: SIS domain-containing protein, partial [Bacteroidales bacterium]
MIEEIKKNCLEAQNVLDIFIKSEQTWDAFTKSVFIMVEALKRGNKIIACGNGGSMCDAMHFAEELTGRFRENRQALPAIAISDPAHITCVANDYGFEYIFSRSVDA